MVRISKPNEIKQNISLPWLMHDSQLAKLVNLYRSCQTTSQKPNTFAAYNKAFEHMRILIGFVKLHRTTERERERENCSKNASETRANRINFTWMMWFGEAKKIKFCFYFWMFRTSVQKCCSPWQKMNGKSQEQMNERTVEHTYKSV